MATLWVAIAFPGKVVAQGATTIVFTHFVGNKPLILDAMTYESSMGQLFTVSMLKYYIGKIHLTKADGTDLALSDYYLVNEEEPATKKIALNIPDGQYTSISFLVGVDSADNCSGAQAGALDPANAMFWAWNTGYIFFKLEGKSPSSASPGHIFEYHIGGYKAPANCIRRVTLNFEQPLITGADKKHEVIIKADVAEFLKKPNPIDFAKLSSVTDFHNATIAAGNYAKMFSLLSVK
jgi:hypothetical protein